MTMNSTDGDGIESSADDEADPEQSFYTPCSGLVGLQNIANTCYMNAALQALSNTPPLTGYFLECGDIIEANYEMAAPTSSQRKTGLAKGYYRLVKDMWLGQKRRNGYDNNATKFGNNILAFRNEQTNKLKFIKLNLSILFDIHRLCGSKWHFICNSKCTSDVSWLSTA